MAMVDFFGKIWNTPPSRIFKRLLLTLGIKNSPPLKTFLIKEGQADGISINLPDGLKSYYFKMSKGDYEPYILNSLLSLGGLRGKTVWDIGAHIGYHTLLFAKFTGDAGRVIAFEPNSDNLKSLRVNTLLNKPLTRIISTEKTALSDRVGTAKMLVPPDRESPSSSGGRLADTAGPYENEVYNGFDRIEVPLDTMDNAARRIGLEPDIIKIDVEGAEVSVLRGGRGVIARKKPTIVIEIHTVQAMYEALEIFRELNYDVRIIDADSPLLTRNILAIPKKR